MNRITLFLLFIIPFKCFTQVTTIPDSNFEQVLINLGYDSGTPDGIVPTANINTITGLDISYSNITDLTGIEDFIALDSLTCAGNNLTQLDFSNNTNLYFLDCSFNSLTQLNVKKDTLLTLLEASSNFLSSIDLTKNTELVNLGLRFNDLTSLDLSNNSKLESILCKNNQLSCLNVKNGNNYNVFWLEANNNSNLTCIEVDDSSYSYFNWTSIDSWSNYSNNCNNFCSTVGINEYQNNYFSIFPNPGSGIFNIEIAGTQDFEIEIYNMIGQYIYGSKNESKIDISNQVNGVYFINIYFGNKTVVKKIIKN